MDRLRQFTDNGQYRNQGLLPYLCFTLYHCTHLLTADQQDRTRTRLWPTSHQTRSLFSSRPLSSHLQRCNIARLPSHKGWRIFRSQLVDTLVPRPPHRSILSGRQGPPRTALGRKQRRSYLEREGRTTTRPHWRRRAYRMDLAQVFP